MKTSNSSQPQTRVQQNYYIDKEKSMPTTNRVISRSEYKTQEECDGLLLLTGEEEEDSK